MIPTVQIDRLGALSRLAIGCSALGGRISEADAFRAIDAAMAAGVNVFDIARSYGYGDAEGALGRYLRVRSRRARSFVITKAGISSSRSTKGLRIAKAIARRVFQALPAARRIARPALGAQNVVGAFTPALLEASVMASLEALQTDYVDALLLHSIDVASLARPELREFTQGLVKRGIARRVGVAAGSAEAIAWCSLGEEPTGELPAAEVSGLGDLATGPNAFWVANQPLRGGRALGHLRAVAARHGIPREEALRYLLHEPLRKGAHCVAMSMFGGSHASEALAALHASAPSGATSTLFAHSLEELP